MSDKVDKCCANCVYWVPDRTGWGKCAVWKQETASIVVCGRWEARRGVMGDGGDNGDDD